MNPGRTRCGDGAVPWGTAPGRAFAVRRLPAGGAVPFWALLGAVLTAGCEDVRHDYLPLEVGSSWTYRVVSEGRVRGSDTIRVLDRLEHILEEEGEARGDGRFGAGGRFSVKEPTGVVVWSRAGRDVFRVSPGGGTVTTIIKYPPFVGFGWTDKGPGGGLVYCRIVGREAVETPAGWFFDCIVIERRAQDFSSVVRQWFAPEVGLVKWRVERPRMPAFEWLIEEYRTPNT
jgi:hypothetical protein